MNQTTAPRPGGLLIVGTGALATLFAWRLGNAGHNVTLLGEWTSAIESLREKGARLVDARGNEQAVPVTVAETPRELAEVKQAIVLVKSWQTERAARQLVQCLAPDGLAITLQNGLGNYEVLEHELGENRTAMGTTTAGATLLGPGLVKAAGNGSIAIQSHAHMEQLATALKSAGFALEVVEDAKALIWGKLVVNSAINPLTALLRVPNGELLKRPTALAFMRAIAQETAAIARSENVKLPFGDPATAVEDVARKTAGNYSSMLQDIQRGAPTEIGAICGAVVRAGHRNGIPTPFNEACWRLVEALSEKAAS